MTVAPVPAQVRATAKAMRQQAVEFATLQLVANDLRQEVDAIAAQLLAGECALFDDEGQRILENRRTWLATDQAACDAFYAAMNRELKAAGIKPADMDEEKCPALVAEHAVIQARRAIIHGIAPLVGIDPQWLWGEKQDQFFELAMGLILNA